MEVLHRAFRKYLNLDIFKDFPKYEENITVEGKSNILSIVENKNVVIMRKITVKQNSNLSLNINIKNSGRVVIYDEIMLEKNSSMMYKLYGRIEEVYHYIKVIHSENSKSDVDVKVTVLKKFISIGTLEHPFGSKGSYGKLTQLIIAKPESKVILIPGIKVLDQDAKAFHVAKKIVLTEDQEFYLRSKGVSTKEILDLLEKSIIYGINLQDLAN